MKIDSMSEILYLYLVSAFTILVSIINTRQKMSRFVSKNAAFWAFHGKPLIFDENIFNMTNTKHKLFARIINRNSSSFTNQSIQFFKQ